MVRMGRYILENSGFKMDFRESLSILIKHNVIARWINVIRNIKKEQGMPREKLKAGLSSVTHSCLLFNVSLWLLARERVTIPRMHCREKLHMLDSLSCTLYMIKTCHTLVIGNRCYILIQR